MTLGCRGVPACGMRALQALPPMHYAGTASVSPSLRLCLSVSLSLGLSVRALQALPPMQALDTRYSNTW